jgi:hypothetical protein
LAEVVAVRLPADLLSGTEAGIGGSVEGHVFPHVPSVVPPALDSQWRLVLAEHRLTAVARLSPGCAWRGGGLQAPPCTR